MGHAFSLVALSGQDACQRLASDIYDAGPILVAKEVGGFEGAHW